MRVLIACFLFYYNSAIASCVEQVTDFLAQFEKRPFHLKEWGQHQTNRYTRTFSIIDDLVIEIQDKAEIPLIAKAAFPKGRKRRRQAIEQLTRAYNRGKRRVSISLIASPTVGKLTNSIPPCDGPNCLNASLKYFYPNLELEETHPEKLRNYLRTEFRPLKTGKIIQFGDLLLWRNPQGEIIHAAIYLNEKWIWHKATYHEKTSWHFEQLMHVNMMYGIDSKNHGVMSAYRHRPRRQSAIFLAK